MAYDVSLKLDGNWESTSEIYNDESGAEITHLEAQLAKDGSEDIQVYIDIYAGDMPEGETAEDQAFANYAETIGFDDEDENEESPIVKFKFNGRNAWGFEAVTEDNCPMRFIATETRKGVLAIIVFYVKDDEQLNEIHDLLEKNLRIK